MLRIRLSSSIFIGCLLSIISLNALAKTEIIVSMQAPPDKEFVMPPGGYVRCYMVPATHHNAMWVNRYRVCEYRGHRATANWISGHWACDRIKHHVCKHWNWVPSHWEGNPHMVY